MVGYDRTRPLLYGNAARSVMAGAMLEASGFEVEVTTAGTHVIEHQPVSIRTRYALNDVGLHARCTGAVSSPTPMWAPPMWSSPWPASTWPTSAAAIP